MEKELSEMVSSNPPLKSCEAGILLTENCRLDEDGT